MVIWIRILKTNIDWNSNINKVITEICVRNIICDVLLLSPTPTDSLNICFHQDLLERMIIQIDENSL